MGKFEEMVMFNIIDFDLFLLRCRKCDVLVDDINGGKLQCQSGCSIRQKFEAITVVNLARSCYQKINRSLVMAHSGANGSLISVAQMVVCIGQLAISNHRLQEHNISKKLVSFFTNRILFPGFV